jgi:hypothetical protein
MVVFLFFIMMMLNFNNALAQDADPVPVVFVSDAADIEQLSKMNENVKALSESTMKCMMLEKLEAAQCHCKNLEKLKKMKGDYEAVLSKHPDWNGIIVSFKSSDPGKSTSLNFPVINKQLAGAHCLSNATAQ